MESSEAAQPARPGQRADPNPEALIERLLERQALTRVAIHELKNIAGSLHGFLQLLEGELEQGKSAAPLEASDRLRRLTTTIVGLQESLELLCGQYLSAGDSGLLAEAIARGGGTDDRVPADALRGLDETGLWEFAPSARTERLKLPWATLRKALRSYLEEVRGAGSEAAVRVEVAPAEHGRALRIRLPAIGSTESGADRAAALLDMGHEERVGRQGQFLAANLFESVVLLLGGAWDDTPGVEGEAQSSRVFSIPASESGRDSAH